MMAQKRLTQQLARYNNPRPYFHGITPYCREAIFQEAQAFLLTFRPIILRWDPWTNPKIQFLWIRDTFVPKTTEIPKFSCTQKKSKRSTCI